MPGTRPAFLRERWPLETFATENVTGHRRPPQLHSARTAPCLARPGWEACSKAWGAAVSAVIGEGAALGFSTFLQVTSRDSWATLQNLCCAVNVHTDTVEKTDVLFPTHRGTRKHPRAHTCTETTHPQSTDGCTPAASGTHRHRRGDRARTEPRGHTEIRERTPTRTQTGVQRSTPNTGRRTRPGGGRAAWPHGRTESTGATDTRPHGPHTGGCCVAPTSTCGVSFACLFWGGKTNGFKPTFTPPSTHLGNAESCPPTLGNLLADGCWDAGAQQPAANPPYTCAYTPAVSCPCSHPRSAPAFPHPTVAHVAALRGDAHSDARAGDADPFRGGRGELPALASRAAAARGDR